MTILPLKILLILCCQKTSRIIQIQNMNFTHGFDPPSPLYTMCKKTSDLVEDGFPKLCPQPGSSLDHMSGFGGEIADETLLHLNI